MTTIRCELRPASQCLSGTASIISEPLPLDATLEFFEYTWAQMIQVIARYTETLRQRFVVLVFNKAGRNVFGNRAISLVQRIEAIAKRPKPCLFVRVRRRVDL